MFKFLFFATILFCIACNQVEWKEEPPAALESKEEKAAPVAEKQDTIAVAAAPTEIKESSFKVEEYAVPQAVLPAPKVTLCLCWRTQSQFAGFYVALEKGFYKEEGLDVTLKAGGPDVRPFQEIAEKRAQFGIGQAQEVLIAIDKGIPIQCVANNFQTGALRLVSKKSLGISDPADLRGKSISLWFGGYEYQCLGLLEKYGISKEDVSLVKQGWDMDAFCDGKVDVASVMVYNELNTLYEKGVKDLDILNYADYGINFPEDAIFALQEYIQQNPKTVSQILRASYRGWRWAMENPQEALEIVLKYAEKPDKEHEKNMLREVFSLMINNHTKENGLGYIYSPDWAGMAKILFQQKLLKEIPDLQKVIQSQFIDQIKILPKEIGGF
ncbi:MAG: ABC transporter substrate-binding protein [Candidatus Brocadiae bacterium]|nr:ABC transporter substrate-binding protein [Candidatus Brocadiia bacterium]